MKTDSARAAFTLLEMAIVLAIIALLTHLAVVKLDRGTFKPAQARRQLDAIAEAIAGTRNDVDPAGQPTRLGFVADMGRLPRAVDDADGRRTLSELWQCPDGDAFAVRAATPENLAPGSDAADADPQVFIACGWHGPYVETTRHGDALLDPWGNAFVTETDGDGGIAIVRCLGSDGAPGWDGRTDAALDIAVTNAASASLTVIPTFRTESVSTNGIASLDIDMLPRPAVLRVYGPSGAKISVARSAAESIASGGALTVSGLTPGPRVFRIERDGARGDIRPVVLAPGENVVRLP